MSKEVFAAFDRIRALALGVPHPGVKIHGGCLPEKSPLRHDLLHLVKFVDDLVDNEEKITAERDAFQKALRDLTGTLDNMVACGVDACCNREARRALGVGRKTLA